MFYVEKQVTVSVEGSLWKPITCEFCHLEWAYCMTRRSDQTGSSPYFLDNAGARSRARRSARQSVDAQLGEEIDPVWCPGCGMLQMHMFKKARFDEYGYLYLLAGIAAFLGVIIGAFWRLGSWESNWLFFVTIGLFTVALMATISAKISADTYDPNAPFLVRDRKGKQPPNKVLSRTDYEAAREQAIALGLERSALIKLTWKTKSRKKRRQTREQPSQL